MIVIALVGPSGAGKSTIITRLSTRFRVQPERYMELNTHHLDNRLVLSKWLYIGAWFDGVLGACDHGEPILITDRSPIDTVAYANDGTTLLLPALLRSFVELESRNISVRSILITADLPVLLARQDKRLESQPARAQYHETDIAFSTAVARFYEIHSHLWSATVNTAKMSIDEATEQVAAKIHNLRGR